MKTLVLIRHAKSDWENGLLQDIERPLNERGYSAANLMSRRLGLVPDLILTSPAVRAASTALIFARNIGYDANRIRIRKELYESSVRTYLNTVRQVEDTFQTVLLFGHNPIISDTAAQLCPEMPTEMPTCAVVRIAFQSPTWQGIAPGSGRLVLFDYPKKGTE